MPEDEGKKIRSMLAYSESASAIDPCVGQGAAFHLITRDAPVRRYGIELDAERARIAGASGIETIQGNTFDAITKPESFSLLYLNPPYDSEIGSTANGRMEAVFLEHTYRWLVMQGVLILVIPYERLHDCAGILSSHFTALNVFRMTDLESVQYRQIAILGVRHDVRGSVLEKNKRHGGAEDRKMIHADVSGHGQSSAFESNSKRLERLSQRLRAESIGPRY